MKVYINMILITNILVMSIMSKIYVQPNRTNMLFTADFLDTYKIDNQNYPLSKRKKDDYLLFTEDMTCALKAEDKNSFLHTTNGAYILMINEKGDKKKPYY